MRFNKSDISKEEFAMMGKIEKMTNQQLRMIKKAVKSVRDKSDIFYISGESFTCRWNGKTFLWTAPSGETYNCTAAEVLKYIGDGKYITNCDYRYKEFKIIF